MRGPAFVLGNADWMPRNLHVLDHVPTFGINRILRIYEPTVLLWVDLDVWNDERERVARSGALTIAPAGVGGPDVPLRMVAGSAAWQHKQRRDTIQPNGNTAVAAARLALALGFCPVYMVGVSRRESDAASDFWGSPGRGQENNARLVAEVGELVERHAESLRFIWCERRLADVAAGCRARSPAVLRAEIAAAIINAKEGRT